MYAEAAARAHLDPPAYRQGLWARVRAAFGRREVPKGDGGAAWTVAAAPIVAKDECAEGVPEAGAPACFLAAAPLQRTAYR